ncbi:hypothetical protein NPIL_416451 [Nephila pilipes]|uniref:Uncharacterized protein n=1 Tax=Nephila pilipes TaxID=299642 RepID=A0A8X6QWW5_NEPPI|nr:hypothetical protein NPIL_416451 [Nephila pilipes]
MYRNTKKEDLITDTNKLGVIVPENATLPSRDTHADGQVVVCSGDTSATLVPRMWEKERTCCLQQRPPSY